MGRLLERVNGEVTSPSTNPLSTGVGFRIRLLCVSYISSCNTIVAMVHDAIVCNSKWVAPAKQFRIQEEDKDSGLQFSVTTSNCKLALYSGPKQNWFNYRNFS